MFVVAILLVGVAAWDLCLMARGRKPKVLALAQGETPWWVVAIFGFLGFCCVVGTVPGLFFNEPHWLIDHIFGLFQAG
jgi:hypothetical protein